MSVLSSSASNSFRAFTATHVIGKNAMHLVSPRTGRHKNHLRCVMPSTARNSDGFDVAQTSCRARRDSIVAWQEPAREYRTPVLVCYAAS